MGFTRGEAIRRAAALAVGIATMVAGPRAAAQPLPGVVTDELEISEGLAGFGGDLDPVDAFGYAVEALGDHDGDGVPDLAVGTDLDDDGGTWTGAVWILFLNADGTVKAEQKISALDGGFGGTLAVAGRFGSGVASLGDLDGDGVGDIAVGSMHGGAGSGALWILFLNLDGTVKGQVSIDDGTGPLMGLVSPAAGFGRSVESLGDLDGDGTLELAIGAWKDGSGAVFVISIDAAANVLAATRIGLGSGGFGGVPGGNFGTGVARLGDLDGDGTTELAVGANAAEAFRGEVWVLFLDTDGTVKAHQRIAADDGGFGVALEADDLFGTSVGALPDRDGDGLAELAVGAVFDDDGATWAGAAYVLFLDGAGQVKSWQKVSDTDGGFDGGLTAHEFFGGGLAALDLDGDGNSELAVGAGNDDDFIPVTETGSVWMLWLNPALWRDHGLGLAGAAGVPKLVGEGALAPGVLARLTLSGAAPGALSTIVFGASQLLAPFKGGTMFPFPDAMTALAPTSGTGDRLVQGLWPAGVPSGFEVSYQAWIVDAAGPFGFAASNGVSGRTP